MLTAAEARALSGKTVEEKVETLLETIAKVSREKKVRKINAGCKNEHEHDPEIWVIGAYKNTPDWHKAKAILEKLGYKVEAYYESQFGSSYTIVSWEK